MLKGVFNVDYDRLVILTIPTDLRRLKFSLWVKCLVIPVKMIYSVFMNNRASNLYNLTHNSQVCYLRKVLNDSFDPVLRRITIAEGSRFERKYIYTNAENQPKYLGKIFLRQFSDYADTGFDFRVLVPDGFDLSLVIHQMKAIIDYYKLASKRYKIQHENE